MSTTWYEPGLPLTNEEASDLDDIDNHLIDCTCDDCIDNLIATLNERIE